MNVRTSSTLADAVWPAAAGRHVGRAVVLAVLGSLALTVSAKVQIPFWPVPMTLQTLVVLLLGMAFGARLALLTVALYLAEGALGLPVFAGTPEKGLGLAYMAGPTGGYLLGFALAAWLVGRITATRRDDAGLALAAVLGTIAIYAPGVAWLAAFVGLEQALALGVLPFLWGDLLKATLAVALGMAGNRLRQRRPTRLE